MTTHTLDIEDLRLAVYRWFRATGRSPGEAELGEELGISVMGRDTLWWGGCCWGSFALAHLLPDEPEVLVATRCPGCATPHVWVVGRDAPPQGD